jgi:hypothetical protein
MKSKIYLCLIGLNLFVLIWAAFDMHTRIWLVPLCQVPMLVMRFVIRRSSGKSSWNDRTTPTSQPTNGSPKQRGEQITSNQSNGRAA